MAKWFFDILNMDENTWGQLKWRTLVTFLVAFGVSIGILLVAGDTALPLMYICSACLCLAAAISCMYGKLTGILKWPWAPLCEMSREGRRSFWLTVLLFFGCCGSWAGCIAYAIVAL